MLHEYLVIGRKTPTDRDPEPTVYKMRLFAPDAPNARSRFWYFLSKLRRVKKANGEVISVHEISEKNPNIIKNFGIWLRYDSRSGTHNMYKEYRDTHLTGAVQQMYNEMAGRHRARKSSIQIIRTAPVAAKDCRRENIKQFHNSSIKFPMPPVANLPRTSHKQFKSTFKANRPSIAH